MKLQLMIAKLNASLEDQSDTIISNLLPRLLREVESLQHETVGTWFTHTRSRATPNMHLTNPHLNEVMSLVNNF
jgi:hypothetical protein